MYTITDCQRKACIAPVGEHRSQFLDNMATKGDLRRLGCTFSSTTKGASQTGFLEYNKSCFAMGFMRALMFEIAELLVFHLPTLV